MDLQFEAVSIVDCFAVCSETLFFMDRFAMGDDGLPPIPAWGLRPQTPSSALRHAARLYVEGEGNSVSFQGLGLKPRARCAGFSVAKIGNHKEPKATM